jgi:uncharacterized repeat protein (TIGR01451 family)
MFSRLVQRKRPRRSALLAIGVTTLVAIGLIASVVLALVSDTGTYDLTSPNKETSKGPLTLSPSGGSVEYIGSSAQNQASGTGLFDPFVRLQGSPTEKGYNTCSQMSCSGDVTQFDTKPGSWTHVIPVNAIPVVDCDGSGSGTALCWELFNDINEGNNAKRISLNVVEVWFTTSATLTGYVDPTGFPSGATKEYEFNGNILINDVNQGSGRGDLRYLIPTAGHTWTSSTFFVLYSKWGTTTGTAGNFGTGGYSTEGGFEEWKVRKAPNISILKTANPVGPVNAGDNIGFDITVSNTGAAAASNVTITDPLPAGGDLNWSLNPAFTGCSISGAVGTQVLTCSFSSVAAGGTVGPIHVTSATTAADCAVIPNVATVFVGGLNGGSSSASVTVNCGALMILKQSTKAGNPLVANAGAVFSITGPNSYSQSVEDNGTGSLDEDTTIGEVCISGLAPGSYTINETSPPDGYGAASQANVGVTVANGTNCTTSLPAAGATATFTNSPLYDLQVNFRDGGSGETSATISCTNTGTADTTPATDWDTTSTFLGEGAPETVVCTIAVDP